MRELSTIENLTGQLYLKIKIKSLAAEAKIIRKEEKNKKYLPLHRESIYRHRIDVVRREARVSLIAYACIRNKPYSSLENPKDTHAVVIKKDHKLLYFQSNNFWEDVKRLAIKYGAMYNYSQDHVDNQKRLALFKQHVEKWISTAQECIIEQKIGKTNNELDKTETKTENKIS